MIRLGKSTRFTRHEIDEFRQVGLDMSNVKHQQGIEQELSRLAHLLADERFDLLEKIALEMAKANGAKLPRKLGAVRGETEIECTPESVPQIRGTPRR
jgi:recombinational DNA repair ATPase RecF